MASSAERGGGGGANAFQGGFVVSVPLTREAIRCKPAQSLAQKPAWEE